MMATVLHVISGSTDGFLFGSVHRGSYVIYGVCCSVGIMRLWLIYGWLIVSLFAFQLFVTLSVFHAYRRIHTQRHAVYCSVVVFSFYCMLVYSAVS